MKPLHRLLPLLAAAITALSAGEPDFIPLWPGAAPGSGDLQIGEQVTDRSTDPARPDRFRTHIVQPGVEVHRPGNPNGASVIVAPGGGYQRIVIDKEAPDTTAWLNSLGVTVFVLRYRLPCDGHRNNRDVALQDAQRAVRLVRSRAAEWGLDPGRIGFLGYSAGGHLAASAAFFPDRILEGAPDDEIGKADARPDFVILGYAHSGIHVQPSVPDEELSPRDQVFRAHRIEFTAGMRRPPPAFILHANDDPVVSPVHSTLIYTTLREAGTPAELHIFETGGHGFGIRDATGPASRWPELCAAWMKAGGILQ